MNNIKKRLQELGFELPKAPEPVGNYKATLITGNLLYVSGQLPIINGKIIYQGQIAAGLSLDEGIKAAQLCALNILSQIDKSVGFDAVKNIIKVEGYISAATGFEDHANVLNGASDLFAKVLDDKAGHIRTVVGCTSLPLNAPVEISVIVDTYQT
jgi:enamine deaminase RidA (YjgF/YER057c/UK114 family)